MHILMVLISFDFPPDIRVAKEARALAAAGHHVTLVCENRLGRPAREQWQGIEIIRLPPQPRWWRQLNTATLFITHRSPVWGAHLRHIVAAERPDALHIHDLPFVGPALRVAQPAGLPVVADMHENFPAYLQSRQQSTRNWLERLSFDPHRFARYERQVLPQCDAVIAVVEEAAERIAALGVPRQRIYTVGNAEDVEHVPAGAPAVQLRPSPMTILYVGGLQELRGLQTVIAAMPTVLQTIPGAQLVIVGDGYYRPQLERLVAESGVGQAVTFEGQQPFEKVHRYIEAGDVCIVPHLADELVNSTIPHKLFQYMYMGKAVIVSSARPLARIVRGNDAGVVFTSGDPADFARAVLDLRDPAVRARMGQNGHRAVVERYNWQNESRELVRLYAELALRTSPRR